jgi:hypothetical protein
LRDRYGDFVADSQSVRRSCLFLLFKVLYYYNPLVAEVSKLLDNALS